MVPDILTLTINGMVYSGWTEATLDRRLDKMNSALSVSLSETWDGQDVPWPIVRFDRVVAKLGADVVLTGYVTDISISFEAATHTVAIEVVSWTQNLVDCTPDIASGQYRGYTLEAIARSICALFAITVVVTPGTDVSQTFADATLQRCETAFSFLERLARLAAVLMTDNAQGNLVLTTAGAGHANGSLVQGENILSGSAKFSADKLFSIYIVKGQRALGSTAPAAAAGDDGDSAPVEPVATQLRASAIDPEVPFYRPHIAIAEAQLDAAGMQRRANWERNFAFGRSTEATIKVVHFRQPNGALWVINQLVSITASWLRIDQDLLVVGVRMRISDSDGLTTELTVGPIEGYTPDPGQVKLHAKKGKKGRGATGSDWTGSGT